MINVLYVPRGQIFREMWPRLSPFIEQAVVTNHGEHTLEDVLDGVLEGRMQLWAVMDDIGPVGAAVSQVVTYPSRRVFAVPYLGGSGLFEWWPELDRAMVEGAKKLGCSMVQFTGRQGWDRAATRAGYERQYVTMGKEV